LNYEFKNRDICSLENLLNKSCNGKFALTFDDVFSDVFSNAYPVLVKLGIPFTLFVSTGLLDSPGYITSSELKIMSKDPLCTVGSHTVNHVRLRTSERSLEEIENSKKELEKILGKEIQLFAYPYGSIFACSRKNIREAKKAGYRAAFSTIRGFVPFITKRKRFFLPRFNGDHFVSEFEKGNRNI
jgi:peptidoglycan/xylan/chitin deacetylase (PgdA/CDA1 family)